MAHGLEVRAPFLDADLAEFALRLPARFKAGRRRPRQADPARAGRANLRRQPVAREEAGIQHPGARVAARPARPLIDDLLSPASLSALPQLNATAIAPRRRRSPERPPRLRLGIVGIDGPRGVASPADSARTVAAGLRAADRGQPPIRHRLDTDSGSTRCAATGPAPGRGHPYKPEVHDVGVDAVDQRAGEAGGDCSDDPGERRWGRDQF